MGHYSTRLILILFTMTAYGCAETSRTEVKTVKETSIETILFSRASNTTSVTFDSLTEGSAALTAGNYSFTCDVSYTVNRSTLAQTQDDTSMIGASYLAPLAQSFKAPATGKLRQFEMKVIAGGPAPINFNVSIYSQLPDAAGGGQLLATESATAPITAQWLTIDLTTPLDVVAGNTYYIVLRAPTSLIVGWYMDYGTNRIADGEILSSSNGGATWSPAYAQDTAFKVHVDVYSAPTYKYSYNGISSQVFSTYPAGQQITLDGGAAGIFKFTPLSLPPGSPLVTSLTDAVSLIKQSP